jgi:hypothetical protein
MSNILTILVTLMIYFLSHSFSIILDIAHRGQNEIMIFFTRWLQLLFPPFEALNIKDVIWTFNNFNWVYFSTNILYSVIYLGFIILFSVLIFKRKKFES